MFHARLDDAGHFRDERRNLINMLNYFQILILALIQGACELLPVSSSAHVIAAEKLMKLDPASPEMTMLLVMLHTGTMFAVIVYFWKGWRRDCFASAAQLQWFAIQIVLATICTGVVGYGLKEVIEKIFMRGLPHAEVEELFANLPLIAGALAAVGLLIIYAGWREENPRAIRRFSRRIRAGSASCRASACRFAGFPVPARPFPPDCCSACPSKSSRNSVLRWPWS